VQIGDDIENILRRMILLTQERDYRKLTHQNLIAYKIATCYCIPRISQFYDFP